MNFGGCALPCADREKGTHAFAARAGFIEDVDLESIFLSDFRRFLGKTRRRHQVGRRNREAPR